MQNRSKPKTTMKLFYSASAVSPQMKVSWLTQLYGEITILFPLKAFVTTTWRAQCFSSQVPFCGAAAMVTRKLYIQCREMAFSKHHLLSLTLWDCLTLVALLSLCFHPIGLLSTLTIFFQNKEKHQMTGGLAYTSTLVQVCTCWRQISLSVCTRTVTQSGKWRSGAGKTGLFPQIFAQNNIYVND